MYGLPQAVILAQQLLDQRPNERIYRQRSLTPLHLKYDWRPIYFTLFIDHFGMKYIGEELANHLVTSLSEHYIVSQYWEGKRCLGMTLDRDYEKHKVHISILD